MPVLYHLDFSTIPTGTNMLGNPIYNWSGTWSGAVSGVYTVDNYSNYALGTSLRATCDSSSYKTFFYLPDISTFVPPNQNVKVTARVRNHNNLALFWYGQPAMGTSLTSGYAFTATQYIQPIPNDNKFEILRYGSASGLSTVTHFTTDEMLWRDYTQSVIISGNTFYCYINNQLLCSATDSTYTSGKMGFICNGQPFFIKEITVETLEK
jgi:hypothetical protein